MLSTLRSIDATSAVALSTRSFAAVAAAAAAR
jgi:hypothetical protein